MTAITVPDTPRRPATINRTLRIQSFSCENAAQQGQVYVCPSVKWIQRSFKVLHSNLLQFLALVSGPVHSAPPCSGSGLLQSLSLLWTPPPHDTEQDDHPLHSPQFPSILSEKLIFFFNLINYWITFATNFHYTWPSTIRTCSTFRRVVTCPGLQCAVSSSVDLPCTPATIKSL